MKETKINATRIILISWTIFGVLGLIVSLPIYLVTRNEVAFGILNIFIILAYEFLMRIILGIILILIPQNPESFRFKVPKFELKLYDKLNYKKKVTKIPTFNPDQYDTTKLSMDEVIENTCKNEFTHKVFYVLTFLPILWCAFNGYLWLSIIVSIIVCQNDVVFITMQRFSRNRLKKLRDRMNKNKSV